MLHILLVEDNPPDVLMARDVSGNPASQPM
jgi:hypothetical protein